MTYSFVYCAVCGETHVIFDGMDHNRRCRCGMPVTSCFTERWFEPNEIDWLKFNYETNLKSRLEKYNA